VAATVAAVPVASVQPAPAPAAIPVHEDQAALAEQQLAARLSAKRQDEMRAFALSQQRAAQPISLFADGELEGKQVLAAEGQKIFQLKRKTENRAAAEIMAFQFQR
jgi:murein endopeptidase